MEDDYDEIIDLKEIVEENKEELLPEDVDIPETWWTEGLREIKNPKLRKREIEIAEEIYQKDKELNSRCESGEIDKYHLWAEDFDLGKEKTDFSTPLRARIRWSDLGSSGRPYRIYRLYL